MNNSKEMNKLKRMNKRKQQIWVEERPQQLTEESTQDK